MKRDGVQAGIEHRIAELRAAFPRISDCRTTLEEWREGAQPRHALRLDIRWPQHQSLVSGPACDTPEQAVAQAFDKAVRCLTRHA
jgi:hypothetical protein